MSKAQLKKNLMALTKEQVIDVVLAPKNILTFT